MATTIQVKEPTLEFLKRIKKRTNSDSYDQAIIRWAKKTEIQSMAGSLARKKRYSRKEILKGLRDEHDRF